MKSTRENQTLRYVIPTPTENLGVSPHMIAPGTLARCIGVDGRYLGTCRRFPGMTRLGRIYWDHDKGDTDRGKMAYAAGYVAATSVGFFKYAAIQDYNAAIYYRGFVVQFTDTGDSSAVKTVFIYYDSDATAWKGVELTRSGGGDASGDVDVACNGKYLYFVESGQTPQVWYCDGGTWTSKDMGPTTITSAQYDNSDPGSGYPATSWDEIDIDASTDGSGTLREGDRSFCYRYYDSVRKVYSGMVGPYTFTTTDADGDHDDYVTVTVRGREGTKWDQWGQASLVTHWGGYDTVQVFRSTLIDLPDGSTIPDGTWIKEQEVTLPTGVSDASWTANLGHATSGLSDEVLVRLGPEDFYDPYWDEVGSPPNSGLIGHHRGVTYLVEPASTTAGENVGALVWSNGRVDQPENFPVANREPMNAITDDILALLLVDDVMWAIGYNTIYRLQKQDHMVLVNRIHHAMGIVARNAACAVGNSAVLVSPIGVVQLDSTTGAMTVLTSLHRLVHETRLWANSLSSIHGAYDAKMGAIFFSNSTEEEALVLWTHTRAVNRLADWNFNYSTQGPLPTTGGVSRAFFVTRNGQVLYPNATRDASTQELTMLGVPNAKTVNGTATGGTANTLVDTAATFSDTEHLQDAFIWVWDVSGSQWLSAKIASISEKTITTAANFKNEAGTNVTPASGDKYAISPVPFKVVGWPLGAYGSSSGPRDFQRGRQVNALQVNCVLVAGATTSANPMMFLHGEIYNGEDTSGNRTAILGDQPGHKAVDTKWTFVDNPSEAIVPLGGYQGDTGVIFPGIRQMASDVDFELLGFEVLGDLADSNRMNTES